MQSTSHVRWSGYRYSAAIAAALLFAAGVLFYFLIRIDLANSSTMATAILLDFAVTIPFFYWLFASKKNVVAATVIPVALLGLGIGWLILPADYSQLVSRFTLIVCPLAALIVASIGVKTATRAAKTFRAHASHCKVARINSIVRSSVGDNVLATTIAQEVTTCYYLLRRIPKTIENTAEHFETPLDANIFSYHRSSGMTALLLVGVLIVTIEIAAVHILIAMFSHPLAWLASASSLYVGLLIVAQTRAIRSRPIYLHGQELHIRNGMFDLMTIKLNNIAAVTASSRCENDPKRKLNATVPATHNVIVSLKEPTKANLLYGQTKMVDSILLHVDEPDRLIDALQRIAN